MRDTRSLRVFNENYPLSRSFSLRVVGVLYPHTPLRGYYTLALLSPPNVHLGYACDEAATSFLVLTALRHSGRSFTAHVAESAEVSMGLCPIPYARVLYPRAPMLFVYSSFERPFCQGTAPKKFAREARKIFRALDNIIKLKFINSGRHSLPSALIANLHALFIDSTVFFDVCLPPISFFRLLTNPLCPLR